MVRDASCKVDWGVGSQSANRCPSPIISGLSYDTVGVQARSSAANRSALDGTAGGAGVTPAQLDRQIDSAANLSRPSALFRGWWHSAASRIHDNYPIRI